MTRAELDAAMREVLTQLALCSHIGAAGYEPRGRSRATNSVNLVGGDKGNEYFARAYGMPFHRPTPRHPGCVTDEQRKHVIDTAGDELRHLRGNGRGQVSKPKGETLEQLKARIVKDGEGFPLKEVAINFRCGERIVRAAREEAGREPAFGRVPEAGPDAEARRARALELKDEGLTVTQIAKLLGVHRSTVERDLGKRAA